MIVRFKQGMNLAHTFLTDQNHTNTELLFTNHATVLHIIDTVICDEPTYEWLRRRTHRQYLLPLQQAICMGFTVKNIQVAAIVTVLVRLAVKRKKKKKKVIVFYPVTYYSFSRTRRDKRVFSIIYYTFFFPPTDNIIVQVYLLSIHCTMYTLYSAH